MTIIRYGWGSSTLGEFAAAASERGLVTVEFVGSGGRATLIDQLQDRYPEHALVEDHASMAEYLERVVALIEDPAIKNDLRLDMQGTDFELKVWSALRNVPAGRTVTYGDIATQIGAPNNAREVGEACAANIGRGGSLSPCGEEGWLDLWVSLGCQAQARASQAADERAVRARDVDSRDPHNRRTSMIKAWAAKGPKQKLERYEYDPGELGAEEVEIVVETCSICHSDLSIINNEWGISIYPAVPGGALLWST